MMRYKEFVKWCEARTGDGQWAMGTAIACGGVIDYIDSKFFWEREKAWQQFNNDWKIVEIFVNPLNEMIREAE
jgi:hypothetical protein